MYAHIVLYTVYIVCTDRTYCTIYVRISIQYFTMYVCSNVCTIQTACALDIHTANTALYTFILYHTHMYSVRILYIYSTIQLSKNTPNVLYTTSRCATDVCTLLEGVYSTADTTPPAHSPEECSR